MLNCHCPYVTWNNQKTMTFCVLKSHRCWPVPLPQWWRQKSRQRTAEMQYSQAQNFQMGHLWRTLVFLDQPCVMSSRSSRRACNCQEPPWTSGQEKNGWQVFEDWYKWWIKRPHQKSKDLKANMEQFGVTGQPVPCAAHCIKQGFMGKSQEGIRYWSKDIKASERSLSRRQRGVAGQTTILLRKCSGDRWNIKNFFFYIRDIFEIKQKKK